MFWTSRDVLERIVSSNGNTLWLVNIAPSRMMKNEPFFAQFDATQERDFFLDDYSVWQINSAVSDLANSRAFF
jgi:hypothetical protein